jgi:hypothetical protein
LDRPFFSVIIIINKERKCLKNDQIEVTFMLDIRSPIKIGQAIAKMNAHSLMGTVERISNDDCDDRFLARRLVITREPNTWVVELQATICSYLSRGEGFTRRSGEELKAGRRSFYKACWVYILGTSIIIPR